jgi:hypothetical protein
MTKPERRFVSPDPDGGWRVDKPGGERASAKAPTKREATERATEIVENLGGGEVTFRDEHGRITNSNTTPSGRDPFPPRDRKH